MECSEGVRFTSYSLAMLENMLMPLHDSQSRTVYRTLSGSPLSHSATVPGGHYYMVRQGLKATQICIYFLQVAQSLEPSEAF